MSFLTSTCHKYDLQLNDACDPGTYQLPNISINGSFIILTNGATMERYPWVEGVISFKLVCAA